MTDDGLRPDLAKAILARVESLRPGATCCPSEIARDLAADWRPLMAPIRDQAIQLQQDGFLRITQRGKPVAGVGIRGPIRLAPATQEETDVSPRQRPL